MARALDREADREAIRGVIGVELGWPFAQLACTTAADRCNQEPVGSLNVVSPPPHPAGNSRRYHICPLLSLLHTKAKSTGYSHGHNLSDIPPTR